MPPSGCNNTAGWRHTAQVFEIIKILETAARERCWCQSWSGLL